MYVIQKCLANLWSFNSLRDYEGVMSACYISDAHVIVEQIADLFCTSK